MLRQWVKRCVSATVCAAMLFQAVPIQAENNNGLEYKIIDEEVVITGYAGTDGIVNIPETIDGYPVTTIDERAFNEMDITDVTIPKSVKIIGTLAFGNCASLKHMTINAVNIEDDPIMDRKGYDRYRSAFYNAGNPDGFEVVFGEGVYRIPQNLFATSEIYDQGFHCKISKVTIAASIMQIGLDAFANCFDLQEVIYYGPKSEWDEFITVSNVGGDNWRILNQGTVTCVIPEPTPTPKPTSTPTPTPRPEETPVEMHRVYNPNSGEHFYTAKLKEKEYLEINGWTYEGVGWVAPELSKTPVYRLYNSHSGDHHYTMKEKEKDALVKLGWTYEGIGWYSDEAEGTPLYREYNPNMKSCNHNYTTNKKEHNALIKMGWRDEGIGWYGMKEEDPGFFVGSTEGNIYTNKGFEMEVKFTEDWILDSSVTEKDFDKISAELANGKECTIINAHVKDKPVYMQIILKDAGKIVHEEERGVIERKLDARYRKQAEEMFEKEKLTDTKIMGLRTPLLYTMVSGLEISYTDPKKSTSGSTYSGYIRYLYITRGKTIMVVYMYTEGLDMTNQYHYFSDAENMFDKKRN